MKHRPYWSASAAQDDWYNPPPFFPALHPRTCSTSLPHDGACRDRTTPRHSTVRPERENMQECRRRDQVGDATGLRRHAKIGWTRLAHSSSEPELSKVDSD
eukprot:42309-Rhodomonas_salina.1